MQKKRSCGTCGVELTDDNTYIKKNRNKKLVRGTQCKECIRAKQRESYSKKREIYLESSKNQNLDKDFRDYDLEAKERRQEKEFIEEWERLEKESLEREKVVDELKADHKCFECKWGKWIKVKAKFVCMLPKCWKEVSNYESWQKTNNSTEEIYERQ